RRTKVSSRFQVTIPKAVRQQMDLRVGQKMEVITKSGVIILVPDRPILSLRGFVKGIPTDGFREKKDRM
ncbi:MAG TPA: AbrB/MazE/SpoVT family DNA-binding domain-containing protein, partial [Thermoanaerobaculia bacterium]